MAVAFAPIVRESEWTVRCWLKRYLAEGIGGLQGVCAGGAFARVTPAYRDLLLRWRQAFIRRRGQE